MQSRKYRRQVHHRWKQKKKYLFWGDFFVNIFYLYSNLFNVHNLFVKKYQWIWWIRINSNKFNSIEKLEKIIRKTNHNTVNSEWNISKENQEERKKKKIWWINKSTENQKNISFSWKLFGRVENQWSAYDK